MNPSRLGSYGLKRGGEDVTLHQDYSEGGKP